MSNEYIGRFETNAAAQALGFNTDEIAILIAKNKLRPLGSPKANGRKYFAAIEIERLGRDIDWLGHFFGQISVTKLVQGDRVNQIDMPRHQRGKGLLGPASGIVPHQFHVIADHPASIWPPTRKGFKSFL
jgi:hypothetical protein